METTQIYSAYINTKATMRLTKDRLYLNNVGSIEKLPYYLVIGDDRYQIVKFGVQKRPSVTKEDISKYIELCITKDFWMATNSLKEEKK